MQQAVYVLSDTQGRIYSTVTDAEVADAWPGLDPDFVSTRVELDNYESFNALSEIVEEYDDLFKIKLLTSST
jgi:hypothetical protein